MQAGDTTEAHYLFEKIRRRLGPAVVVVMLACNACAGTQMPRYKLPLGRTLDYSAQVTVDNHPEYSEITWRCTVVAENADGSSTLVVRRADDVASTVKGQARQSQGVNLGSVDVFPDGHVVVDAKVSRLTDPRSWIFPPLPANANELDHGWSVIHNANVVAYSSHSHSAVDFVFTQAMAGQMHDRYGMNSGETFTLDVARGMVTGATGAYHNPLQFSGTTSLTLVADKTIPAAQATALGREYQQLVDATAAYQEQWDMAVHGVPQKAIQILDAAKSALSAAAAKATDQDIQAQYAKLEARHEQAVQSINQDIEKRATAIDKAAPDFSTTDLDAKQWRLSDLRGKVVVMDFWEHSCEPCLRAFPAMEEMVQDLKDKPVIVLGMNTDSQERDARFKVDEFHVTYPTLRAGDLAEKYHVDLFPAFIVIDQRGIIREYRIGYNDTLREDLEKVVFQLLEEPPQSRASQN